ncbi:MULTISPECIES: class I SAM-dependent methyltransferase [Streptomyces]|uniref:class I SAM-dependent methyltransferase n=1 Tax=Streptomyces TaxID=1883 RepID=UPI001FB53490|nr:class I SAM-dependent methyltransferase [Streptomyces sp. BK205]
MDAGCGTGGVGLWLTRALSVHLAGLDLSAAAVQHATARANAGLHRPDTPRAAA